MPESLTAIIGCHDYKLMKQKTVVLMDCDNYVEVDQMYNETTFLGNIREKEYDLYVIGFFDSLKEVYGIIKDRVESGKADLLILPRNIKELDKSKWIIHKPAIPNIRYELGRF
jgi:hypothetical protein